MAHNLHTNANGKVSMFYYGETPWHALGQRLENPATAEEAIEAACLDYDVVKMPLQAIPTLGQPLPVENYFATVRTDTNTPLAVVGRKYTVLQNRDAFKFFDALVGQGEAMYHTAGVLGKGERIWILAKLPGYIKLKGEDIVEKYLLLVNGHDGKTCVKAKLTPVRVVCNNTLNAALNGSEMQVNILHRETTLLQLHEAHKILGLTNQLYDQLESIFNNMTLKRLSDAELIEYATKLVANGEKELSTRKENQIDYIVALAHQGAGANLESANGTLWGAYNAATEFADHVAGTNRKDAEELKSIWFGTKANFKERAFDLAVSMLN
jgi:phage/plasmid-like protein (TIGR03299 family)